MMNLQSGTRYIWQRVGRPPRFPNARLATWNTQGHITSNKLSYGCGVRWSAHFHLTTKQSPLQTATFSTCNMHATVDENNVNASGVKSTPARFTMPVESARHAYTMMAFPSIDSALDQDHLEKLQSEVMAIANAIAKFEPVHVYTRPELVTKAESMAKSNVVIKSAAAVNELWIRDTGPVFARDASTGERTAIRFNFNYWGKKLPFKGDERAAEHITDVENHSSHTSKLVTEGGAIEHDGEGTFLGAQSCIFNDNRNPSMTKAEVEAELRSTLGVESFIWVAGVKGYDITDCHIDALARFVEPGVILLSRPAANGPRPMIEAYVEARDTLAKSKDAKGRSIVVHECEEPDVEIMGKSGDPENEVIASYANFYLVSGAVIVPKFGQSKPDDAALELFKRLFPAREIVQVHINMLPRTGGGIHCATQQVPM